MARLRICELSNADDLDISDLGSWVIPIDNCDNCDTFNLSLQALFNLFEPIIFCDVLHGFDIIEIDGVCTVLASNGDWITWD